ncbi:Multidrug resistance protein 1 [Stylosanthes scabra]|uniref:Multidrug resistance protein 1 n=1 Tax=Stylosanthes scabra TaxID=79078 RepID=A0ABU6R450_9FABA|nr:Multidrug resistance protein 1 [Stylosanthes scabra]
MVQDAISEKLGNFIHYLGTFISGFAVGFSAVWQLALITLVVVPMIAVIRAIHTTTLAKLYTKSQEALSQAGNIAEQFNNRPKVVLAFVGENRALQGYSFALRIAQQLGYKTGFAKGTGLGATYFLSYERPSVTSFHSYRALSQSAPSIAAFGYDVREVTGFASFKPVVTKSCDLKGVAMITTSDSSGAVASIHGRFHVATEETEEDYMM